MSQKKNMEALTQLIREQFDLSSQVALDFVPILKGGSGRTFYRVSLPEGKGNWIVMHYTDERIENSYYVAIGQFLEKWGLPVPHIRFHDKEQQVIGMEDLGAVDLCSLTGLPWEQRSRFYQKVLRAIKKLHDIGWNQVQDAQLTLMPGFDASLYEWERNYFFENFLSNFCGLTLNEKNKEELKKELENLAQGLLEEKIALVHRDFQSQNVIVQNNEIFLIDFQGMRSGTFFYDLGSLLYDPYVSFTEGQRLELLRYYFNLDSQISWEIFQKRFYEASVQRLLQALGAYGFLGKVKGKTEFLTYIPAALQNLKDAASRCKTVGALETVVGSLRF
ncbi:MAG: phosphotransferase [Verrucomicrobiae bacterium]|nr:phosphotransferase [Verrucomicrobiae bacterium]